MKNITLYQFIAKLSVTFIPFVLAYLWIVIRSLICDMFLYSGIALERDAISKNQVKIIELQNGNWSVNASQVQNFASITVAIVLLVVVFVIEKSLNIWSETYLDIVILIIGVSCLTYTFSLQFWNCALDRSPDKMWLLKQRKTATTLQVVGWNGLYLSVVLCVSFANTWCGTVLSIVGAVGLIITTELKVPTKPSNSTI